MSCPDGYKIVKCRKCKKKILMSRWVRFSGICEVCREKESCRG